MSLQLGIDIGSTTVKIVVMSGQTIKYKRYERHHSQVRQKTIELLNDAKEYIDDDIQVALSGSAGLGLANAAQLEFVQEVFATAKAVRASGKNIDVVIELGGEDAKIIFLTGGLEERMNGTCAGGTGAFIDQMATLLNVTPDELDELSLKAEKIYPIASRCGVFAKSDIQPLLNQNASKADIAASIFQAVVDQTITGLAQGRQLSGRIAFLGGPLFFFKGLQKRFVHTLNLTEENSYFPSLAQYSVSVGAAMYAGENASPISFSELMARLESSVDCAGAAEFLSPLFENEDEYESFCKRHERASLPEISPDNYTGNAYLGIDCGSTTTKLILISSNAEILYSYYGSNRGNPIDVVKEELIKIYKLCGRDITLRGCAVTGYGEDLIKNAFSADAGLVETMAHFRATRHFCPNVDFILDIGGQDIKCFQIKNNSVDSIMLNEACSSGCGSFIETFARSMGYEISDFAKLGVFARRPVDLGSRCTVFMNSSVKQAQKEGASVEDISAGLSISVVKNALYKVIRAHSADELGEHIVVQGGTFHNDAVLRSLERELGRDVIRPTISGLMGAFGAALYAKSLHLEKSSLISLSELEEFSYTSKRATCTGCTNKCELTVNIFPGGGRFISGNKCERALSKKALQEIPNLFAYKWSRILNLASQPGWRGKVGIPLGLNMIENIPFWHAFFTSLGYQVVISEPSSIDIYNSGRYSIPSDTACYPAKLMHGHIENLLDRGVDLIFYPCMTYNFDEKSGDNHFNCPVVAYYPELLRANVAKLGDVRFMYPFFGLHRPHDFMRKAYEYFKEYIPQLKYSEIKRASKAAFREYNSWQADTRKEGKRAIAYAQKNSLQMVVLAGRPYHIDPEINHGIDRMLSSFGIVVLTEDCVCDMVSPQKVNVLNQWTYHSRLYNAAKYCASRSDTELIQLVSFGCGIDAITTDEVREILEREGKLYTQIKIDEINNLGPVKIRIRSLLSAIEERKEAAQ